MISEQTKLYRRTWQKTHAFRMRSHKLKWYYKHRKIINMMFSKATSIEPDLADRWYAEKHPEG